MADFTYQNGPIPAAKTDKLPLPTGENAGNYVSAADLNLLGANEQSLRTAVLAGQYHGLQDTPATEAIPAPGSTITRSHNGRQQVSENGRPFAEMGMLAGETRNVGNVSATLTPDFTAVPFATLTGNATVANPVNANSDIPTGTLVRLYVVQDGTGYRTLTWGTAYKGVSQVMPKQGPGMISRLDFVWNGDGTLTLVDGKYIDTTQAHNVLDWGADPTGVAVATTAIQNALATGNDVFLPEGRFVVDKPLRMKTNNQSLRGVVRNYGGNTSRQSTLVVGGGHIMPVLCIAPQNTAMPTVAALLTGTGVAGHFDGASTVWLGLNDNYRVNLDGKSACTIEFAFNLDTVSSGTNNWLGCQGTRYAGQLDQTFQIGTDTPSSGQAPVHAYLNIGGTYVGVSSGSTKVAAGATHKVAVTYDGSNLRLFLDGTLVGTTAATGNIVQKLHCDWVIGKVSQFNYEAGTFTQDNAGAIDGIRISDSCRYTTSYTASGAKPAWDANTVFLHNFDNEQSEFSVAYSRGFYNEQQQHWIFVRRNFDGTIVQGITLENISIVDGIACASGIWAKSATGVRINNVASTAKIKLFDNAFTWSIQGLDVNVGSGEREALGFGNACGASTLYQSQITGGTYQIFGFGGGWSIKGIYFNVSSVTKACIAVFGDGAAYTNTVLTIDDVFLDSETALTGTFEAGIVITNLHVVRVSGGDFDPSPVVAPAIKLSNVDCFIASGVEFKMYAGQEVINKDGSCPNSPIIVGCKRIGNTTVPWSNTTGWVCVDDGSRRTNLKGISGTDTPAQNLNGTASATGATATATVTFGTAEADTSYRVTAFVPTTSSGGTPAAGSNRVLSVAKTTAGFTVTLEAAPGVGITQNFDWAIQR